MQSDTIHSTQDFLSGMTRGVFHLSLQMAITSVHVWVLLTCWRAAQSGMLGGGVAVQTLVAARLMRFTCECVCVCEVCVCVLRVNNA